MDMTRIDARKMQMTGDLIMKNSVTVGGIAGRPGSTPLLRNVPSSKLAGE